MAGQASAQWLPKPATSWIPKKSYALLATWFPIEAEKVASDSLSEKKRKSLRRSADAPLRRGRICVADFRGGLGITNKVFFDPLKNTVFLQILQIADKRRLRSIKTGVW